MTAAEQRPRSREAREPGDGGWRQEVRDLMRGIAGGAIVGMPLLYTMEMWWHAVTLSEGNLLLILGATLALNFLFSYFVGLREEQGVSEAAADAVTALGVAFLFAGGVLALVGQIHAGMDGREIAAKILMGAAGVSLGISFANAYRGRSRTGDEEDNGEEQGSAADPEQLQRQADLNDIGATLAGATIFALNIAPTEEILLIAARLGPWQQLIMLGSSLLLCYVILFASGFQEYTVHTPGLLQHPVAESVMACALSLGVAFVLVLLLGDKTLFSHPSTTAAGVIALGLPAAVGGAAGRLVV